MDDFKPGSLYEIVPPVFNEDVKSVFLHRAGEDTTVKVDVGRIAILVTAFFRRDRFDFAHVMIDDTLFEIDTELIKKLD